MPGRIRQEDVEQVRERSDLTKVVSGYLQLKKTGRDSLSGLCPFHPEKTPSFSVSPTKQVYYCFGCGEGGNVFRFLEKIENLSFPETVERLAKETGVTLRYEGESDASRRSADRREVLHRANAEAARLYHRMLTEGREAGAARAYLDERGIEERSVERFAVGFAPTYPDYLLRRLSKTYSPEVLVEAGLATRDDRGNLRDRFRGRVMFPIHDRAGKSVGFGARHLAAPGKPAPEGAKYLNTAESPVYRKSSLLYNLNRAKAEITRTGRAFVVEGYTDVIALDQAGIGSVVATCGTALGEDHLRLLSLFTDRLVLAFDSDAAGVRAAERAYGFHQQYPVDLFVLILPEGLDPADFVLAHRNDGDREFEALAGNAIPLVEYMIRRAFADRLLADVEERSRAVRAGLEIVVSLEDPVRRESYARLVASMAGEREHAVMLELQRMAEPLDARPGAAARDGAAARSRPGAGSRMPPQQRVERESLRLLVQTPDICPVTAGELDPERFGTPSYRKIFEFLRDASPHAEALGPSPNGGGPSADAGLGVAASPRSNGDARRTGATAGPAGPSAGTLVSLAQERGEQLGRLVAALAVEPTESDGEPTGEYAAAVFDRLEEFHLGRQIDELRRELERLNPQKEPRYEELFGRMVALLGRRRRLMEEGGEGRSS
jgi:DNA primase